MNKDEILRKAVLVAKQEPIGFDYKTTLENKRKLEEASGRLVAKKLDDIEKQLSSMQDQMDESDKKAPIRSIWTGVVAGVLSAVASYFVMKYVTIPTTKPLTTPNTTANSKKKKYPWTFPTTDKRKAAYLPRYAANPKFDPNEDNATKLRSYPIFAFTFFPGTATRAKRLAYRRGLVPA